MLEEESDKEMREMLSEEISMLNRTRSRIRKENTNIIITKRS